MPVTGSGEIKLRADVNNEINGNNTDTNVSLRALSEDAGESVPDALSEFYGYSSVSAPTISYSSQSSNYTQITLNVVVNWNGHSSGTYKLECEIYSSAALGTNLYETVTASTASGSAPSGDQNVQFVITPTTQYADDDQDYRLKIKATNEVGTTTESGNDSGYRSATVTQATQYSWRTADQGYYRGWVYQSNINSSSTIKAGSFFRDQVNHPQLGWYTTHQTTASNNGSSTFTGAVYVPDVTYTGSFQSYYTIADTTTGGNGVYHRNIYPHNLSSGSRPNRRMFMSWDTFNSARLNSYYYNTMGCKHSNTSMTAVGSDYNNLFAEVITYASGMPTKTDEYNLGNSTHNSYNGTQVTANWNHNSNGTTYNFSGKFEIEMTFS